MAISGAQRNLLSAEEPAISTATSVKHAGRLLMLEVQVRSVPDGVLATLGPLSRRTLGPLGPYFCRYFLASLQP